MNNDCFKVRVWNVLGGYYLPEFYLTPAGEICEFGVFNGTPMVRKFNNQENYRKERCTGLTDKNGKLIYEGDVFEADVINSFDGDKFIGQKICGIVAYYPNEACFTFAAYGPMNLGEIKIIGNIHDDHFRDAAKMVEAVLVHRICGASK